MSEEDLSSTATTDDDIIQEEEDQLQKISGRRCRRRRRRRKGPLQASLVLRVGSDELRLESRAADKQGDAARALICAATKWQEECLKLANSEPSTLFSRRHEPPSRAPTVSFSVPSICKIPSLCTTDLGKERTDLEALGRLSKDEKEYLSNLTMDQTSKLCAAAEGLAEQESAIAPLRFRVIMSSLPIPMKQRICTKLERLNENLHSSEVAKYTSWVEACLSLPLNRLIVPQLPLATPLESVLREASQHLDRVVYGHRLAKQAVLERVFNWYTNPYSPQRPLAFCGTPGNGKTTLAKHGIGPLLGRSVQFISLGGAQDCSTLVGHGYTFEGSQPGRIVECVCASTCMNPLIYFDELDKVSQTPKGEEILNVLVHLTDASQSDAFRDRFIHGVDLDLSLAVLVFSFNDIHKVPSVLLDRMQVVQMEPFTRQAQRAVITSFLLPKALSRNGAAPGSIKLGSEAVDRLLELVDASSGLRGTLDILDQLVTKACLWLKVKDETLTYPLGPKHFGETSKDTCLLTADAVETICSSNIVGSRPRVLSMYS